MSEGPFGSYAESGFGRSSQGSTLRERRQKGCEDREHGGEREYSLGEGSFQTYWTMSGTLGRNRLDKRDEKHNQRDRELERLRRLVRDLELQARDRHEEGPRGAMGKVGQCWGSSWSRVPSIWVLSAPGSFTGICGLGINFPRRKATLERGHGQYEPCIMPTYPVTVLEGY